MSRINVSKKTQKKIFTISFQRFFIVLSAFYAFMQMSPYFLWYPSGLIKVITLLIVPALIFVLGFFMVNTKISKKRALAAAFIIIYGLCLASGGDNNLLGFLVNVAVYFAIAVFICQTSQIQARAFDLFCLLYALSLIPGIVFFLLKILGISVPHNILYSTNELKTAYGHYYEQYFGSVIYCTKASFSFCGMFDEPGVVGTFSALLFSARLVRVGDCKQKKMDKAINAILLLSGFLSSSKAFFVIIFIAIMFYLFSLGRIKAFFGVLALFLTLIVALNIQTNYTAITEIQTIINNYISTGTLSLGRAHTGFDAAFEEFLQESARYVLWGHGLYASQQVSAFRGSAEIRMLIYDIGFVGIALVGIWLVSSPKKLYEQSKRMLSYQNLLVFVFVLSMYQRQYVLTANYMMVLFGGSAYISIHDKTINNARRAFR